MTHKTKTKTIIIRLKKQKSPDTILWDKEPSKIPLSSFLSVNPLLGMQPSLENLVFPVRLPQSGYPLSVASGLRVGHESTFPFSSSADPCQPCMTFFKNSGIWLYAMSFHSLVSGSMLVWHPCHRADLQ